MKEIPLTQGHVALVDDADYERAAKFNWNVHVNANNRTFYARGNVGGNTHQRLHRFILNIQPGDKRQVDHIDRNGLNNCRSNLRVCTIGENNRNVGKPSNNSSGWKGVSWDNTHQRFRAYIQLNRKKTHLGYFHSPITAALEYDKAARTLHGEFACLNVPAGN